MHQLHDDHHAELAHDHDAAVHRATSHHPGTHHDHHGGTQLRRHVHQLVRGCTSRRNGNCRLWSATTRLTITTGGSTARGVDVLMTLSDGDTSPAPQTERSVQPHRRRPELRNATSLTFTVTTVEGVAPTAAAKTTINRP